ncbi:MAG: KpsF/GutQ family sugar-phosphate isomerase [Bdellovibrionales bacterium]
MEIQEAKRVLKIEAEAILGKMEVLGDEFVEAVQLVLQCEGKLIVTGMGKSGQIGSKISSTFSSTGTPSLFLSPAESIHGDLGVVTPKDLVLAISNGGESAEMFPLINYASRKGIPIIAMTGNLESTLAKSAKVTLDISIEEEACPLKLAPTTSSTVTLALGDALAMTVLKKRGFNEESFAEFHPGGKIGRKLLTTVKDVMHSGEALPLVSESTPMNQVISAMTLKEVRGVAGVVSESEELVGIVTDGDIRRILDKGDLNLLSGNASAYMSRNPKTIDCRELAQKALFVMEQFSIQTLFVVDRDSATPLKPMGLIHLQDLLKANVK